VEYQLERKAQGRRLFQSLLPLPAGTPDLCEIIDEAGSFLIRFGAYKDGRALYRAAVERFPAAADIYDGLSCCAGHEGAHDEAVAAAERALQLGPDNQEFVNNLGWSLFEAGRLDAAVKMLEQAVSMDPTDELARENLRGSKASSVKKPARSRKRQSQERGNTRR
jgi:Flp pilus assembly protein TadD